MVVILLLLHLIIPFTSTSRIVNLLIIFLFMVVGGISYFVYTYKAKTIDKLFGKGFLRKLKSIFIK